MEHSKPQRTDRDPQRDEVLRQGQRCTSAMKRTPFALLAILAACAVPGEPATRITDVGPFTIDLPTDLAEHEARGIDSFVGEWRRPGMRLSFDYGQYSNDVATWDPGTEFEAVTVDGKPARIGTNRQDFGYGLLYATAISFRNLTVHEFSKMPVHLTVFAACSTPADCAVARRIFLSIRFRPE
jgi:hypothetical protein